MSTQEQLVLVTGANGFVGSHCVLELLRQGYRVRAAVRGLDRRKRLEALLAPHLSSTESLSFAMADLGGDEGWDQAARGCSYVLHVGSPVPRGAPKHPDDVIVPARDGTLRVLAAAKAAGVKRVVLTSSTAAVLWGHKRDGSEIYDESHWTVLGPEVAAYERSKTLAERAAWEYAESGGDGRFELTTLLPGLILGPVLGNNASVSGEVVRKLLAAEFPGCPDLGFAAVDVRDVAWAHVAAMTHPQAAGRRFILALEHASVLEVAQILARNFGSRGFKVPTGRLPSWLLKIVAMFDKTAALVVPELGKRQDVSNALAKRVLGYNPRSLETMVVDMAESMIQYGIVGKKRGRAAADSATQPA
jgi:nucleoside-diphosphate-sugar epimerase